MTPTSPRYRSRWATAVFDLLNPIPYGLFVGTLIFDILYANTDNVFWAKGAAWLVTVGLFLCDRPTADQSWPRLDWTALLGNAHREARLLVEPAGHRRGNLNAFVHSRDAYAMVPENVILSVITVVLLSVGHIALAFDKFRFKEAARE